jgi:glycosyltransferase involved in cell wall biosynthesis
LGKEKNILKDVEQRGLEIFVAGTRGFPDIQGGVEKHCEILYPLIASEKFRITVFRRNPYVISKENTFRNVRFIDLPSTRIQGFEAFYHTFLCAIKCLIQRPDIVHIHNIGPGMFIPLLKLGGLKVVLTYHSPNYEHKKWSLFARIFLKLAEYLSLRFSDRVIFVSLYQKEKLGNNLKFIHINNGVQFPPPVRSDNFIRSLGLRKQSYVLAVGRLVEEKGFDLLINAYSKLAQRSFQLVIAGDADHETEYSKRIKELATANRVIMPGYVKGTDLQELFTNARLFVLPSYNEGLPISILEAMSYRLPLLVSDIPANKQIGLREDQYFTAGSEDSLVDKLNGQLMCDFEAIKYDMDPYDWDRIASQTQSVYEQIINTRV